MGNPALSYAAVLVMLFSTCAAGATTRPAEPATMPTLFIIGDSTVRNSVKGLQGWGDCIAPFFDLNRIHVENHALGGRSSRSFLEEGLWDKVRARLRPGDFVLMQFGTNDGGSLTQSPARASLHGVGEQAQEITDPKTGQKIVVHTFGWYMQKYASDTLARGATPIILSLVPRCIWDDKGKVDRASNDYGNWAAQAAHASGAYFIDLNSIIADRYDQMGFEKVKALYFPLDHTHTNHAGARLNATSVVDGLRELKNCPLASYLREDVAGDAEPSTTASSTTSSQPAE